MLQVELVAIITGHGSDEYGCGEFCVTSHHFLVNSMYNNTLSFDSAGKQQQMKDASDGSDRILHAEYAQKCKNIWLL